MVRRKRTNSLLRWRRCTSPIASPVAMSSAANSVVVPWRMQSYNTCTLCCLDRRLDLQIGLTREHLNTCQYRFSTHCQITSSIGQIERVLQMQQPRNQAWRARRPTFARHEGLAHRHAQCCSTPSLQLLNRGGLCPRCVPDDLVGTGAVLAFVFSHPLDG